MCEVKMTRSCIVDWFPVIQLLVHTYILLENGIGKRPKNVHNKIYCQDLNLPLTLSRVSQTNNAKLLPDNREVICSSNTACSFCICLWVIYKPCCCVIFDWLHNKFLKWHKFSALWSQIFKIGFVNCLAELDRHGPRYGGETGQWRATVNK